MKTIKQILDIKGNKVFVTAPDTQIIDAVKEMAKMKVGALIVLQNDEIQGIITEQDFTRRVLLKELDSENTTVKDVMTKDIETIEPKRTVNEGMEIMTVKRIRHLPVLDDGKLVGIISIGDLVKEVIADQETIIEQLEQYIHS